MTPASPHAPVRCRVWTSADRSRPADWPCRRMTSSPGRRTSRSSAGLAFACATLSGLAAMMSSTTFSIAPRSVTCFMPRASTSARGSPPSCQTISNRSFAILPEMVPSPIRSTMAAELSGRHRRARNIPALLVEPPEQFVDHPVGGELAVAGLVGKSGQHGFKEVRALAFGHQHAGVVGRQAEVGDEARLLLVRQFRQIGLEIGDIGFAELQRQQVGIREIAVVVRLFLGAHRSGLALVRIEQPGFLVDRAAVLDDLDLAPRLVFDRLRR